MKKYVKYTAIAAFSMGLLLTGCGNTVEPEPQNEDAQNEHVQNEGAVEATAGISETNIPEAEQTEAPAEPAKNTDVVQGGPYGRLSVSLPDGWSYETCPTDSDALMMGTYGIHFYPAGVSDGYIELSYTEWFGVCGTGLSEEQTTIAGVPANIGTYDNHAYWDFIAFQEPYKGVVALTYSVDGWWDAYSDRILNILNTVSFDSDTKEGGAYIYSRESEVDKIGLSFSLKNISPTGATMVFHQYDGNAPTGELEYGDSFVLEVERDGAWENAPIVLEGNYGFNALAYILENDKISERELKWEWLYGALEPGNYRIVKDIMDFRASGDFDEYTVYAYFVLN